MSIIGTLLLILFFVGFFGFLIVYFAIGIRWGLKDWRLQKEQREKYGFKENSITKFEEENPDINKEEKFESRSTEIQKKEKE